MPVLALHRAIHLLAFAGTAFLVLLLCHTRPREILSAVAVFFLGLSLEFFQHLLYGKPMERWDVRDDILAILAAFILHRTIRYWRILER